MDFDWTNTNLYLYLAIGGGVVVVLALLLYFTPLSRLKVPGVVGGTLGGLALGAGLGVMGMTYFGYQVKKEEAPGGASAQSPNTGMGRPGGGGMGGMGMPGGGMGGMGMGMPGGGGRGGPSSKTQLANLIAKLDVLTRKPLAVTLSADQKQKVREQIRELDAKEELSDDEAKKRMDALLDIVKDQRETLENAGYRWPGTQGGGGGPGRPPVENPFKEDQNAAHLKSLREQVGKGATE
jgi:hypothetical protein